MNGFGAELQEAANRIARAYKTYTPQEQQGDLNVSMTIKPSGKGVMRVWTSLSRDIRGERIDYIAGIDGSRNGGSYSAEKPESREGESTAEEA